MTSDFQVKVYTLQSKFLQWTKSLPGIVQCRLPAEVLSALAVYILNNPSIYTIINGLMDIQHLTEKELFEKRLEIVKRHKAEAENISSESKNAQNELKLKQSEELKVNDCKTILLLDEKVTEQQVILEEAGVPNFKVTTDPLEVRIQMHIIDFIIRSREVIV